MGVEEANLPMFVCYVMYVVLGPTVLNTAFEAFFCGATHNSRIIDR